MFLAACKSSSPAPYVSPRITGRVLDQQTGRPIKGVKVLRLSANQTPDVLDNVKGGERMAQTPAERTAADGTFVLDSERTFAPFQRVGWYSVTLAFEHPDYVRYVTNYTLGDSVQSKKGEPLIKAGDIRLPPVPK